MPQSHLSLWQKMTLSLLFFCHCSIGQDIIASVAAIKGQAYYNNQGVPSGPMIDLIKEMDRLYKDGVFTIRIIPFTHSIRQVAQGRADFHMPLVRLETVNEDSLDFSYIRLPFARVAFVAYTRSSGEPFNKEDAHKKRIATPAAHRHFFPFKTIEMNAISIAMNMLRIGRIDAFIMEQEAVDRYIRSNRLWFVRRQLYQEWESYFVVSKNNPERTALDDLLSGLLEKLNGEGKLLPLAEKIHKPFYEWQPYISKDQ